MALRSLKYVAEQDAELAEEPLPKNVIRIKPKKNEIDPERTKWVNGYYRRPGKAKVKDKGSGRKYLVYSGNYTWSPKDIT